MPADGLLLVKTDVEPSAEAEFNAWYDDEHLAQLLSVPGFRSARRFRAIAGEPKYLALYDVDDVGVLESPPYLAVMATEPTATPRSLAITKRFRNTTRGVYRRLLTLPEPEPASLDAVQALLMVGLETDAAHDEEFNDWYDTEHLPLLSQVPGVVRARRYRLHAEASRLRGNPVRYVALYELERVEAQTSDEWRRGRDTPWSMRLGRYFTRRERTLLERLSPSKH